MSLGLLQDYASPDPIKAERGRIGLGEILERVKKLVNRPDYVTADIDLLCLEIELGEQIENIKHAKKARVA